MPLDKANVIEWGCLRESWRTIHVRIEREISRQLRNSIPCVKSRTSSHCARRKTPDTIVKRNTCQTFIQENPEEDGFQREGSSCRSFCDLLNVVDSRLNLSTATIFSNYDT
ncbi:hypothetical protein CEXT_119551 [Caerostris extrusa]|uniref:Uncharacterized protein n=1 Tax=Caerostris extrusa TaxID=172846 RepID=A0AAV4VVG6_CAEEX|nr:hypothetical protein CEXT_119551 [Caerostris extrusa]